MQADQCVAHDNALIYLIRTLPLYSLHLISNLGSNVLPIGRFLGMTHDKQAFRSGVEGDSDRMSRYAASPQFYVDE